MAFIKSRKFFSVFLLATLAGIGFLNGERIRHEFNRRSSSPKDVTTLRTPNDEYSVVISGGYIVRHQDVPIYAAFGPGNFKKGNISFDWNASDSFAVTMRTIENKILRGIENSYALHALKQKSSWTMQDRARWKLLWPVCNG